ncbi:acyl-CoA carboxylase subunit beta [Rhodoferax sp.]|uniref:acyl-CoA carboxylase subunit beta n=1 Tax=Rhodoferax sp. TaxID=50421 RepID=UPI003BB60722
MKRIDSRIDTASEAFRRNHQAMSAIVANFRERMEITRHQRPPHEIKRVRAQGKLLVRERLDLLLDPGTPFLEFSALAACEDYNGEVPGANVVTGLGMVSGREVLIHADDSSVKGGVWYTLTPRKLARLLDIALENQLPVLHLCDSGGAFLEELSGVYIEGGRVFRNQCLLSKAGVPQIAMVFGHCTAGGAYIPALCDYSIIVRGTGGVFLGGPPLVKAATGEEHTADEIGGCDLHTQVSGTVDYPADNEAHAIAICREIVAQFKPATKSYLPERDAEPPYYDPNEMLGIVSPDHRVQFDQRELIARMVDGSRFHEYQPAYGTTLICGYAYIWGYRVGILANNGVLFSDSSKKAAHFISLCNQNRTPLVFLQNTTGYMIGRNYEMEGITKDGAKMLMAQAGSEVPKFTVITSAAFGAGYYGMCGRAWDPRMIWAWPNVHMGVMGPDQAANTLADVKIAQLRRKGHAPDEAEMAQLRQRVYEKAERESNAYFATSRLWDDGLLAPTDTRNALGMALSAAAHAPIANPHYGIFRF